MGRRKREPVEETPAEAVERVLDDERVCWFPVRHFSPASAWHVRQVIRDLRPAAVLVEGPDDATELIPALVDSGTEPPISVLSTWVDKKNEHGQNGVLTPSPEVPVRYRAWWPFVRYSPEYQALLAGAEVGAELAFIDAPLAATVPFHHVPRGHVTEAVSDRQLAEGTYFRALRERARQRDFDAFWEASFEVRGVGASTRDWMRAVLTFAWCTRNVADTAAFAHDGTDVREAHMRWHVDQVRKRVEGPIVVVTGAFHSVALASTRGKRAKQKADRNTTTLLCAHSHPALARLYGLNRAPAWGGAVWGALEAGESRPHAHASREVLVEVMRRARVQGLPVS
ncbi:MAG: hypothetical protein H6736_16645, partial [Alphaproteobacteria bacterium]|nr:hypothetical protein [Alphaproteobacteria bacterium]